jgi:hypothetical protein
MKDAPNQKRRVQDFTFSLQKINFERPFFGHSENFSAGAIAAVNTDAPRH